MFQRTLVFCLVLIAAACGDDSNPAMPDGPPGGACTGTVGEIASYPGTYMGTVVGGGANLTVGMGECTAETGDLWFDPSGRERSPPWAAVLALPGAHLHLYGKASPRRGRKMGHLTLTAADAEAARSVARQAATLLGLPTF